MSKPGSYNTLFVLNASPTVWRAMEEFHFRLSQALVAQGARVVIVLAAKVPESVHARLESSGASVHTLAYRPRGRFFFEIRKLIKANSIDLVHIRFFRLDHAVAWFIRCCGVRRIIYTEANIGESHARGFRRAVRNARIKVTTYPLTKAIAISGFVRSRLLEFEVFDDKIAIVYNGVDLNRFTPDPGGRDRLAKDLGLTGHGLILSTIARLTPVKRIDLMLRTCRVLQDRGLAFRFVIASQGGDLEKPLKELSASLGLTESVFWVGQTSEPENLLRGSDIFFFTSAAESFGNVLVEAMACGLPVVASRRGAIGEIVVDDECGLLPFGDEPASYAEAILRLANDAALRRRLSEAAVKRAAFFSVERAMATTLEVYNSV
jgi:glycosyltransferase involved in cell wall biosynthesis